MICLVAQAGFGPLPYYDVHGFCNAICWNKFMIEGERNDKLNIALDA